MTLKSPTPPCPWKVISNCSEAKLANIAEELALQLTPGSRVILEGPLGAGKTTFTRYLLKALQITQTSQGSPTFAIAHEYNSPRGPIAHLDFYRLKDESEIDEAGIPSYYWEREMIVISEWLSLFPNFEEKVVRSGQQKCWRVNLDLDPSLPEHRTVSLNYPIC